MRNKYAIIIIGALLFISFTSITRPLMSPKQIIASAHFTYPLSYSDHYNVSKSRYYTNSIYVHSVTSNGNNLYADEKSDNNIQMIENSSYSAAYEDENRRWSILIKVMLITLIIWFGLSLYIYLIDKKIKKLEKKIDEL
ncbi:MAG: CcmD family protein [Spirochaetota bacterium]|nr:CcmD family protein [Spirochaetota bacterium]